MKQKENLKKVLTGIACAFFCHFMAGAQGLVWKNVQIVGGGFVDGIVFHPKVKDLRYCRTDIGGAYRWDQPLRRWIPLLDFLSYEDRNLMGVESLALDPNDPDFLILACGTYTNPRTGNGAILRSFDRGRHFERIDMPIKFGGNENGRGNGERLAVDPANGKIIYLGTRLNGLWRSADRGKTWEPVKSFPDVTEAPGAPVRQARDSARGAGADSLRRVGGGNPGRGFFQNRGDGIIVCFFDPPRPGANRPSTIYVAVSLMGRDNFFRSRDGGVSWQAVPGQPTAYRPTRAVLSSDGMIYISYGNNPGPGRMTDGAVWKYDTHSEIWTDITPDKPVAGSREFGYAAVAASAAHPKNIIASSFNRYTSGGEELFRSTDEGASWKPVLATSIYDDAAAPYVARTGVHWLFDIEIDPLDGNHALFTTGYGGHETYNLGDIDQGKAVRWTVMSTGIEETVALALLSPPKGAPLLSAIGDYGGFVHWDLDKPAPEGNFTNPHFGNTTGIACAEKDPALIVRVGVASHNVQGDNIGYSADSGKSWQRPPGMPQPNSVAGHIAVSADGHTWVWTPQRSAVYLTHDRGNHWQKAEGIPNNLGVIADPLDPAGFYALDLFEGKLYTSLDSGDHFTAAPLPGTIRIPQRGTDRGDVRGGQDRIYAAPGRTGDLWIAAFDGLYHSTDTGRHFDLLQQVTEIEAFGFGKAAPRKKYPVLYLAGVIGGVRGVFQSDDRAAHWVRINDDGHQWGLILQVAGDPKKYGRVYVGTHGRGILFADQDRP